MLAEDVEIAAGPIEPDGDGAHQRQVLAQAFKRVPAACVEQGMGGALAGIALGQIVEAAPVGGVACADGKTAAGAAVISVPRRRQSLSKGHLGDDDVFGRHVLMHAAVVAGLDALDLVDHVHAGGDFTEHAVAEALGGGDLKSRKSLLFTLMKNWALAECGSEVRAMAMVPILLDRPLAASFLMGARVSFSSKPGHSRRPGS